MKENLNELQIGLENVVWSQVVVRKLSPDLETKLWLDLERILNGKVGVKFQNILEESWCQFLKEIESRFERNWRKILKDIGAGSWRILDKILKGTSWGQIV